MRLIEGGIHKRVGFLIQNCGGYDREYHIISLSKKLNIDVSKVRELFNESLSKNILHYIRLLEGGMDIDKIISFAKYDNKIVRNNLIKTTAIMSSFINNSAYSKIF